MAAMLDRVIIEPMSEELILWRCLHAGSISAETLDSPPSNPQVDFRAIRSRNIPLLEKLTQVYGACAIVARDGDEVVATLRFYPMALCEFGDSGAGFCMQQDFPAGPATWPRTTMRLLPSAIEEALRYRSPVQWVMRTPTRTVEMYGRVIPRNPCRRAKP